MNPGGGVEARALAGVWPPGVGAPAGASGRYPSAIAAIAAMNKVLVVPSVAYSLAAPSSGGFRLFVVVAVRIPQLDNPAG